MYGFNKNQRHSASRFQSDMKKLWEENSQATVELINHAVVQSSSAHQWGKTLADNQQKIANGIIKFYGEQKELSTLFNHFIQYTAQAIDIFMWRKDAGKFREEWCLKADQLSNLLNSFNKWNVRGYFYKQIFLIESLVKAFVKKNIEAITFYRQELVKNNVSLSIIFTNGIITDNAKLFI